MGPPPPQPFEKKYTSLYINKNNNNNNNNNNFGFEIYILGPPLPKKIYKLTQEIQQIDNL